MIAPIFARAWKIFRERFGLIAAVTIVIWLPCDLITSYLDAFVFGPDEFQKSFRVSRLLDNLVGIIATAGVIHIALSEVCGKATSFADAMSKGSESWGRLWWARCVSGLITIAALILLILPGIYVAMRLCIVESVAVTETLTGMSAVRRSFALTKDRFWKTFLLLFILILAFGAFSIAVTLPTTMIPALDHWLISAAAQLVCDLMGAYVTVVLFCIYKTYAEEQVKAAEEQSGLIVGTAEQS